MYTFIHPTKTGGSACERFFLEHYSAFITGIGHGNRCELTNSPIIIIRDVKDRFFSMFNYWKYGAKDGKCIRNPSFLKHYEHVTIKQFISFLKNKSYSHLFQGFTWKAHFLPQSSWISSTSDNNMDTSTMYKHITVIKYDKNLDSKIPVLLKTLNIPDKHISLPFINSSKKKEEENLELILDAERQLK